MTQALFLRVHADDDVVVALHPISVGASIDGRIARADIPAGHKMAIRAVAKGDAVHKLGQVIGLASEDIAVGEHVHTHNVAFAGGPDRYEIGTDLRPQRRAEPRTFNGIVRPDGQVGTRNFIGVLTSVNCSATVARRIAEHFTAERLAQWPNVDGVVAFTHTSGCGMQYKGDGIDNLRRTIAGYAKHPNFASVLIVGLGCEVNQIDRLLVDMGLQRSERLRTFGIQEVGGTSKSIKSGIAEVEAMLNAANRAQRTAVGLEHLVIGLQCGGSDGYSALSANPALGIASDLVVAHGGSVVLSETPEIYGAEHLLLRRAESADVGDRLIAKLRWWEAYAAKHGADLNNNPSPGNIKGGITTILEKSLGAIAKSGSTPLTAVVDYAQAIPRTGFVYMDTPGYDPCSATGQIAGGANLICFTTGRGSVFGSKPAPTLKLASNSTLANQMADDIDIDCGRLLTGTATLEQLGKEIFEAMIATASGQKTRSEIEDIGENEFVPWILGAAM
jgi:altronate hydrolase